VKPDPLVDRHESAATHGVLFEERFIVWTLWLVYGAFYFCRTNLSSAVPGLKASPGEGGLGLSAAEIGWILASLKITYGLGQLLNGQLSERFSPRVMLALGMFGSAALNVLFGLGAGFYFLLFVWATNGFCQSLGWTPTMRVAANWVPIERRGRSIGIIGTGYQITLGLTYLVASQSARYLGWRGALYVPAGLLVLAGLFMLAFLREAPDQNGNAAESSDRPAETPRLSLVEGLYWTLYNPTLWLLGLALGLLNACRYGFLDWGLTHIVETQRVTVSKAGLQFFWIAIGATAGSYVSGWATDRFFGSRRAPVICLSMAVLGGLSLVYDGAVRQGGNLTIALLVAIGFCIYSAQVLLVGTAPADLAHRGASAAAAGFVNFVGYMGAAAGDVVTGYYSASAHGGWGSAIFVWAAWAFAGALITALMWNATQRHVGLLPAWLPKVAAVAALIAAGAAAGRTEAPTMLPAATWLAAVVMAVSFWQPLAAGPVVAAALGGLVAVFAAMVRTGDGASVAQCLAMGAYGLASLAALMVLIERKGSPCESS
jgi:sugar phosphate permease